MGGRRAFTLVELLVVIAIIAVLMGMLLPVYGVVHRSMQRNSTMYVLKKAEVGMRLFQTDWKVLPGQAGYPSAAADLTNRLYYHLGTSIDAVDGQRILHDAKTAAQLFDYAVVDGGGADPVEEAVQPSPLTYTSACISVGSEPRCVAGSFYPVRYASLLNRMGAERARLAAISGNLWLRGPIIAVESSVAGVVQSKNATQVFPAPQSAGNPGWASDYLAGEVDARFRSGTALLDAWGRPLVYICQQIPGILGTHASPWSGRVAIGNNRRYGLGPIGFDPTQGPGPALATSRPHLLYGGRILISSTDAGDGRGATPTDPSFLPALDTPKRSDVRYYASPRFARDFELWSCGPDRLFEYMRDHQANQDNISVAQYNRDY